MFRKILMSKNDKELLKLKAQKETLKGMKKEFKDYELHAAWDLGNVAVSKEYLENRFGSIENAAKCLSERIEPSPITDEERERLNDELDYKVSKICVDDIKYTMHGRYQDHLGVSITRVERLSNMIKLEKQNPEYYSKQLKDPKFVENDNDPIQIYLKENDEGQELGTIIEGNNRIIKMKVDMAREMSVADTLEEKEKIREKYSIYVQSKNVKDLDISKRK